MLFIYKLNPISTTSESPDIAYDKIKTAEEKNRISRKISTYEGKTINHKGLLYPVIYLFMRKKIKLNNRLAIWSFKL